MSSALMILQAGSKRIARPHTIFMIHPSNHWLKDPKPFQEYMQIVEENKRMHELFINLTINRSGISRNDLEKTYQHRKYLTPKEALKFGPNGLIDKIED